ncbi:response regulator transcription factor [Cyanobium gracile]|uniref:Response regulator containing a CheY-like receiver domain and an HTH DNA-binding domain n=1 Tax=Cyanobium gracile (strain ATCC 27147 / PCC 6307) TaxID=292564 RepID=K9PAU6_CYAGP|nr:response regulator transcription factor [Cyanobium gracile]AFY30255.1 response regulator containing a CheY-like receiver domain and an HTH DNA-binding domain [Cyanobium gracile PCC 6307]
MRVLLIEDDEAFRVGIEAYLLRLPAVTVVRAVSDGEQGLEALAAAPADVVVLDIGLPGLGGLETCRRISAAHDLPVLVLTSQDDGRWVQRLWDAGASGYLHKAEALEQLATALTSVAQGASWWDRSATRALRSRDTTDAAGDPEGSLALLTPREREVLAAMAGGLTNRQIADSLGLGTGTVRVYLHTIFQKLQVSNRTQAVLKFLDPD